MLENHVIENFVVAQFPQIFDSSSSHLAVAVIEPTGQFPCWIDRCRSVNALQLEVLHQHRSTLAFHSGAATKGTSAQLCPVEIAVRAAVEPHAPQLHGPVHRRCPTAFASAIVQVRLDEMPVAVCASELPSVPVGVSDNLERGLVSNP